MRENYLVLGWGVIRVAIGVSDLLLKKQWQRGTTFLTVVNFESMQERFLFSVLGENKIGKFYLIPYTMLGR